MCTVGAASDALDCSTVAHNACTPNDANVEGQQDLCSIGNEDPMDRHCDTKADIIFLIGLQPGPVRLCRLARTVSAG